MAISQSDVNTKKIFKSAPLKDLPVRDFTRAPKLRVNPYVQDNLGKAPNGRDLDPVTPPTTVLEASQDAGGD